MRWPPYLMKFRINSERHSFGFWIPLFLIGPLVLVFLLAILVIMLPFALLAFIFSWRADWLRWTVIGIPSILRMLCFLPGMKIDVDGRDAKVNIAIY